MGTYECERDDIWKKQFFGSYIMWIWSGKENIQTEEVYSIFSTLKNS